jgi:hypothetical protein
VRVLSPFQHKLGFSNENTFARFFVVQSQIRLRNFTLDFLQFTVCFPQSMISFYLIFSHSFSIICGYIAIATRLTTTYSPISLFRFQPKTLVL